MICGKKCIFFFKNYISYNDPKLCKKTNNFKKRYLYISYNIMTYRKLQLFGI